MGWLDRSDLKKMGFASLGHDVLISDKASIYGACNICLGNHVRIDDFCVLSAGEGGIEVGNHIHIAVFSLIIGAEKIQLHDFSNISSRVSIYSSSDDFSGKSMTSPMVPEEYKKLTNSPVIVGKHAVIGSGSLILPGSTINEGCAIGALSLVNHSLERWGVYAGIPARRIKERKRDLLELEKKYIERNNEVF